MRLFARLFTELDETTSTLAKVEALKRYLQQASPADAAWALYFLAGGKPRRTVSTGLIRQWAAQRAGLDDWLFEASYQAVGDLAETIAHVLPQAQGDASAQDSGAELGLADWMQQRLLPMRQWPADEQARQLMDWLAPLDWAGRFLLIKLVGGGFRVGVSKLLVTRALAEHADLPTTVVAQRMMGYTDARRPPTAEALQALCAPLACDESGQPLPEALGTHPYPFFLAQAMPEPDTLGPATDWLAEWKFDGIRAQIVRREGQTAVWSRGEELLTERFPDLVARTVHWPDGTVVDGELVIRAHGPDADTPARLSLHDAQGLPWQVAPFSQLQTRITRQHLPSRLLQSQPADFIAYDLLQWQGQDLRALPQHQRRRQLQEVAAPTLGLSVSPLVLGPWSGTEPGPTWVALAQARQMARGLGVEGLMLKHQGGAYGQGRTRSGGPWYKWKLDPLSVDAVLIYAQAGHGRRASLYTDYTFAVWSRTPAGPDAVQAVQEAIARREAPQAGGLQLVTFAKAYSGLSDDEIKALDAIIRRDTVDKFGPVRSVRPTQVFEIGFEGLQASGRHKSGVAVRFPRILRWRHDKPLHEADTLDNLRSLALHHGVQGLDKID
jgi:DNA ligase-1